MAFPGRRADRSWHDQSPEVQFLGAKRFVVVQTKHRDPTRLRQRGLDICRGIERGINFSRPNLVMAFMPGAQPPNRN
jgi:hypothetical protein